MNLQDFLPGAYVDEPEALRYFANYRVAAQLTLQKEMHPYTKLVMEKEGEVRNALTKAINDVDTRSYNRHVAVEKLKHYKLVLSHVQEPALDALLQSKYELMNLRTKRTGKSVARTIFFGALLGLNMYTYSHFKKQVPQDALTNCQTEQCLDSLVQTRAEMESLPLQEQN